MFPKFPALRARPADDEASVTLIIVLLLGLVLGPVACLHAAMVALPPGPAASGEVAHEASPAKRSRG
jgi:hypothetical protein